MTPAAVEGADEGRLLVRGGRRLSGKVAVSGAKNSALKLMAASLLAPGTSVLHNVPDIQDVRTMKELLEYLGAAVEFADGTMTVDTTAVQSHVAPYELVQRMRASIQIMGPLVARFGVARVAMPGGCNLGPRKIDIHLRGMADMGAVVRSDHGFVEVTASKLHAIDMFLDYPSVGATENLLMAAVMAEGTTTLENVAREPEIVDLCKFLISMGAEIEGAGSSTMKVHGVAKMHPAEHTVLGDRIEAGTFLIAGALTGGEVEVTGISPHVLDIFLSKLRSTGVQVHENTRSIRAGGSQGSLRGCRCGHSALSGLRHRPAGSDDGAALGRRRGICRHRERVREPLRFRGRADQAGGGHPGGWKPRGGLGRAGR